MLFLVIGHIGISTLLAAVISILLESSPIGLQDENGFHLTEESWSSFSSFENKLFPKSGKKYYCALSNQDTTAYSSN